MKKQKIKYWIQRRTRGWSDNETWDLEWEFIKWVNSRFKKYKELAGEWIDLEWHKFTYKKKRYTQLQLIDEIIRISDNILNIEGRDPEFKYFDELEKLKGMFNLVIGWMGW